MALILLLPIVFAFVAFMFVTSDRYEYDPTSMSSGDVSLIAGFIGIVMGLIVAVIMPMEQESVLVDTYEIVSVTDGLQIDGQLFLGIGQIKGKSIYYAYRKHDDGFTLITIPATGARVVYSDSLSVVEKYRLKPTDAFINNFSIKLTRDWYYVIYVPPGTIRYDFRLNDVYF